MITDGGYEMSEGNETTVYHGVMDSNVALTIIPYLLKSNAQSMSISQLKAVVEHQQQLMDDKLSQSKKWDVRDPIRGDQIRVKRNWMYYQHVVYIGNGRVIHFSGAGSEISTKSRVIVEDSIADFVKDGVVMVLNVPSDKRLPLEEIIARAKSRIGETDYNLIGNNCEHFASWCVEDKPISEQINRAYKMLFVLLIGALAGSGAAYINKMMKENKSPTEIAESLMEEKRIHIGK